MKLIWMMVFLALSLTQTQSLKACQTVRMIAEESFQDFDTSLPSPLIVSTTSWNDIKRTRSTERSTRPLSVNQMPKSKKKSGNVIAVLKVTVTDDDVEDTASEERSELPKEVAIQGSYPNPFRGATTIAFDLPEQAEVYAEVFDVLGRLIFSSEIHKMDAGWDHSLSLEFPTTSSGLYIYRFNVKTASGILSKTGRIIQVR